MSNAPTTNDDFRILIVDDTAIARAVIGMAVRELGFTNIEEAGNGVMAWQKIREAQDAGNPFKLILCDWNMPEMNGMALLEMCRTLPQYKELSFIMITAESGQKQIYQALISDHADYVVKPFSSDLLKKKVRKMVEKVLARRAG